MSQRTEFPADSFVAAAGSGIHLLRAAAPADGGGAAPTFSQVLVGHGARVHTARWNRNNKVVASGCSDGQVQLLYGGGQVMAVLPRDGATRPDALGAVTALSWSTGSKRLAAGSNNGSVFVFDMASQGGKLPPQQLGGHLGGVTALEYQHEDKFLAVASGGGSVVLYPDTHRASGAAAVPLRATADTSARLSLSLAAVGEPLVASGSAAGSVTVWDVPSQRVLEDYAGQHGGSAVHAAAFVPLRPAMLYSAGGDGRVCLQDRRAGPGHVSAFSVGAPITALMVKEDHSTIGVGTTEGVVKLYDPRNVRQPLHSLRLAGGQPVTGLHWQHKYPSLSAASRSRSSAAAAAGAPAGAAPAGPSRLGAPPSSRSEAAAAPAAAAAAPVAVPAGDGGSTAASSRAPSAPASRATSPTAAEVAAAQAQQRGSMSAASQLPAARATPAAGSTAPPLQNPAAGLAVTPLPGMASRLHGGSSAAAAAGEVTPQQQRLGGAAVEAAAQQMQQMTITLLAGGAPSAAQHGQQPLSPLEQLAAAPAADLNITPLIARPPAHQQHAAAAAAVQPRPPPLNVTPLAGGADAVPRSQLCISPLPGMAPAVPSPPGAASASPRQRSALAERTNSGGQASPSGLRGLRPGMLPQLASPLPAAPEAEQPGVQASPSFAENLPLPSPSGAAGPQQPAAKIKAAAEADAVAVLSPAGSGTFGQWSIRAAAPPEPAASVDAAAQAQAAGAAAAAGLPSLSPQAQAAASQMEFSFAAAERSLEQLSSGAAWGAAGVGPTAAGGGGAEGAAAVLPAGLRDDILAMHLDMLQQFQAQQACMGELVSRVLEKNEALSAEVASLRKQLAALTGRRNEFLWL